MNRKRLVLSEICAKDEGIFRLQIENGTFMSKESKGQQNFSKIFKRATKLFIKPKGQ